MYHCHVCGSFVEHVVKYKIKIVIEDGTSPCVFVLVDSAATKLFVKTCSERLALKLSCKLKKNFFYSNVIFLVHVTNIMFGLQFSPFYLESNSFLFLFSFLLF
ncbi:uncharacterized protein DS421_7g213660 [Arachis hypogaea]|nr:uncharacterized protein DS421_7g213660 [Arachis hypogaea]